MTYFTNIDGKYLRASYLASLRIVKDGKPHTVGETLILPAAKDMRRIDTIASNIEEILISQLKMCSNLSLQVDKSTDITNMAQLLVFIRYDFHNVLNEEIALEKMCWYLYRLSQSYVWKIDRPSIDSTESCAILC
ncbi:Hypothetical protein CINCED_3A002224 [Cinara cedri]|uniref:Zinc finger BED domain-containing protein 5 n=1 Tax=Cinara cedri TaxID=506608 RepID=A0A5E4NHT1_9HEMI|nr:Hypothetical protein CINCED_3A002224 [Cinara cedri]